jgi:hypothetical protein
MIQQPRDTTRRPSLGCRSCVRRGLRIVVEADQAAELGGACTSFTQRLESAWGRRSLLAPALALPPAAEVVLVAAPDVPAPVERRAHSFDKEDNRIRYEAVLTYAGIGFNMALNTGQLDEAAALQSAVAAIQQQWSLEVPAWRRSIRLAEADCGRPPEQEADAKLAAVDVPTRESPATYGEGGP